MKKIIPALALIGGAAAFVIYKMKKEEQKRIVDLDQGLLYDDEEDGEEEEVEEAPISDPASCCTNSEEKLEEMLEDANASLEHLSEKKTDDAVEKASLLSEEEKAQLLGEHQKKLEELAEKGDVHAIERPVKHMVSFADENALQAYRKEVINRGFVISGGDGSELELVILHITPLASQKLIDNMFYLAEQAKLHQGSYKGWEAEPAY